VPKPHGIAFNSENCPTDYERRSKMMKRTIASTAAIIICLGTLVIAPASAQSPASPTSQDTMSQHHKLQYQMMKDMTQEMGQMAEQVSQGEMTPEQSKQMSNRMRRMSKMMGFMSGLAARPAHNHAQLQEQMDQMRTQMDEMTRKSRMAPGAN
jgi:hypothetical protein